jgi:curved DNA-binding protein CbpA
MTHYDVLGVSPNATVDEIKTAYRRLVLRYHPDKNPDTHAVEVFRSVTEAYEVLTDPQQKLAYDSRYNDDVTEEPPPHRDPAYRPRRTRQTTSRSFQRAPSLREIRARYLSYTGKMSIACLIVAIAMIADYSFPSQYSTEHIASIYVHSGRRYRWTKLVTDKRESFVLDRSSHIGLDIGDTVLIAKTIFFGVPVAIGNDKKMVRLGTGIYGNLVFFPAMLLIVSGFGVFTRKNAYWGFDFGVGSVLLLIFIVIFNMLF